MIKVGSRLQLSASDLVGHLNCRHLTRMDLLVASGLRAKPKVWDPNLEILWERGAIHERAYIEHLRATGREIIEIEGAGITAAQVEQTLRAMRAGAQVIVQGALLDGVWGGRTDVLLRVAGSSGLGDWSYEVVDTKLARETKGGTVLQLSLYSDLVAKVQGELPKHMHVVTPGSGFTPITYPTAAYAAYYRQVRQGLERSAHAPVEQTYPDPKEHCDVCRWRSDCDSQRRADDHLSLVAGISATQRSELARREVTTLTGLARLPVPLPWKPERGLQASYERSREQARVQLEGRLSSKAIYETLPLTDNAGLYRLPQPSAGDVFLDLEADPFVGEEGLEYLFGYVFADVNGVERYVAEWAFTREEEKRAFERFVDFVMTRWAEAPGLHIYHYAPYEPSALKRLMGRYATREDEIDRMLRGSLFVDLYAVARQSIRASVESYSIKNLEVFYDFKRSAALVDVRHALAKLQGCLELNSAAEIRDDHKEIILRYNRDDCVSALQLRDWLERIRASLVEQGAEIPRPAASEAEPSQALDDRQRRVAQLVERLTAGIPVDSAQRSTEQQACWTLAHLLDWHRRELKSAWWEFFRLAELSEEGWFEERCAIAGLTFLRRVGGTDRAPLHRYGFPRQEVEIQPGETLHLAARQKLGTVAAVSLDHRTIDIKKRADTANIHPRAAFAHDMVPTEVISDALLRLGEYVSEQGLRGGEALQSARDLLLRLPPLAGHHPLIRDDESASTAAVRLATQLERGVLAIQGPPGAGKTFTAAHMICALVEAGRNVGITANSHKVIRNLLDKAIEVAGRAGLELRCIQKASDDQPSATAVRIEPDNKKALAAIGVTHQVAAGTKWLWSRADACEAVDVLFVDEAAQMSLADVLAVSQACKALVLLGDPQQLEQPIQGSHPEGTEVSALDYLLRGAATIAPDQGLFLDETWRLHPQICAFTSELFYEGRLQCRSDLQRQQVTSSSRVSGAGLRLRTVMHEGNQSACAEEAEEIQRLVEQILSSKSTWTDRDGVERAVQLDDILIIAPYNAQVFEIHRRLPAARVGTVDKFQGQEAAIVIYSVTTSSHADAPRGMEFLYSLNRLNVAVSRAKCICVMVASPMIFEPVCGTPRQMQLANAFCRYRELAQPL